MVVPHQKKMDRNYMTEETKTEFRTEGDRAFPVADKENNNSSSSSEGEDNDSGQADSSTDSNGDVSKGTKEDAGFLDHPRWKEREDDWKTRFNDQESRHQTDLKAIREEFGTARKDNAGAVKIPSWFGGNQEQWDAYRTDRDEEIKQAEERAIERVKGESSAKEKAITQATEYMQNQISELEADKELNPDGSKIDSNKLLKFVLDNDLVDSKGQWNYKAGFKIMKANSSSNFGTNKDRKAMAGATTSESKAESTPKEYKTSADFKGSNRPW